MSRGGARPGAGRKRKSRSPVVDAITELGQAEMAVGDAAKALRIAAAALGAARAAMAAEPPLLLPSSVADLARPVAGEEGGE